MSNTKTVIFHIDLSLKNMETGKRIKLSSLKKYFKKVDNGWEFEIKQLKNRMTFLYDSRFGDGEIEIEGLDGRWWFSITRLKQFKDLHNESGDEYWEYDEDIFTCGYDS